MTWSDHQNVAWKAALPGPGASSPVVFDGRVYVTCYSGYGVREDDPGEPSDLTRHLLAFDLETGTQLWDAELPATEAQNAFQGFVALHGYASSTPAVDQTGIYVFYGTTGVVAYDFDGQVRWQRDLGTGTHAFGTANSPILEGELVIINASVECGDLVALDRQEGHEVWRVAGIERSWNTPLAYDSLANRRELVVNTQGKLRAFAPATGEALWECEGIDDYICPSVIEQDGILYALGGRQRTSLAVRSGGSGDVTETRRLWSENRGSNVSSAVYHDGYLYWAHEDRGIVYCANAETGELMYEQRLEPSPGRIYASPLVAGGYLYYVSREQGVWVLAARPEFELVAHNQFSADDSVFNASPVAVGDRLLLRSNDSIYCVQATAAR